MSGTNAWSLQGETIVLGGDGQMTLELLSGSYFELAASAQLAEVGAIDDQALGNNTIALPDGINLTVQLGFGFTTVIGGNDADIVYGGDGGYDTIILGSGRESFYAGPQGATIRSDAAFLGATIDGANRSELDVTGSDVTVTLGSNVSGIADLEVLGSRLTLDTGVAQVPFIALANSADSITLRDAHQELEDEVGGNTITFAAADQTLFLPYSNLLSNDPGAPYGGLPPDTVIGFVGGDTIEINLAYSPSETLTFDSASGKLTISDGPQAAYSQTITIQGDCPGTFQLQQGEAQASGYSGTAVTLTDTEPPCFAAGTRITTILGDRPVEALRVGDMVVTASGATAPIVWIGHRHVDFKPISSREWRLPACVRTGAFGPELPGRDLVLSPDHSVHADGVLIPVGKLINGFSIVRERLPCVDYFHVELADHALLLAEGLEVESYLDTGNRAGFADPTKRGLRRATGSANWEAACAPLVLDGHRLAKVRRRVLARSRQLGLSIASADPPLRPSGELRKGRGPQRGANSRSCAGSTLLAGGARPQGSQPRQPT